MSEAREITMENKNTNDRPTRASVKNHPRVEAPAEGSMPVRAYPPWNSRGGHSRISRLKNHPRGRNA
jgi:hypothetical protein